MIKEGKKLNTTHLIVGGGQKCGTTWLQHVLEDSSPFFCPPQKSEVHFFDKEIFKGFDYYKSLYKKANPQQITVDVTPDYLGLAETVASRVKDFQSQTSTQIKFIFILRDPIERLISAYKMKFRKGQIQMVEDIPYINGLLDYGMYYCKINEFLSFFSQDKIKLFLFENIFTDYQYFRCELKKFLEINEGLGESYQDKKVNSGYFSKSRLLPLATLTSGKILRKIGANQLIHTAKKSKAYQWLNSKNIDLQKEEILKSHAEQIRDKYTFFYREDVNKLTKLINSFKLETYWPIYFS